MWAFSGYTWEELTGQSRARCEATGALLSLVDVLVDGEFVEALRDISLRFRGSSNQRLLDAPPPLAAGRPIPLGRLNNKNRPAGAGPLAPAGLFFSTASYIPSP